MGAQTGSDDFEIYSHAANKKIIIDSATGNTTLGGNLTVSGTGGVQLNALANLTWGGAYGANIPTIAAPSTTSLAFYPSGSTSGESMRLVGAGNLLLGTTTDTGEKLQVNGNATFAGDLTVSGSNVGVGTAASAAIGIYFDSNALTGTTLSGILSAPTFANNGSPTLGRAIYGAISVQNAAYTLATGYALHVGASSVGSSATLTTAVGLRVENQGSPGAGTTTHAYGIDIAAQSGAATTNVAIRAAGKIMFTSLPTSSVGLASGELWNDSGTVKIA
jgi:hypothetical protein